MQEFQFESINLNCIFGCRQFRNQNHLTAATNSSLVNAGLLPSTIRSFATISNPPKGKTIKKRNQYLDKFHMDIVFVDCVALGGHQYALLLVDVATRYCWLYGMSYLSSTSITSALEQFKSEAGHLPQWFHSDFNRKFVSGNSLRWILWNGSNIITDPTGRQSIEWISRTHTTYSDQNGERIHQREASRKRILVLRGSPCRNYSRPSSWLLRPETHHTI